jgi:hypothetical protein
MNQNFMVQELSNSELEQVAGGFGHHCGKPHLPRCHEHHGHRHKDCFAPHFHHECKPVHCHVEYIVIKDDPCH